MLKPYAISISARKPSRAGFTTEIKAGVVMATDQFQATGKALDLAHQEFPRSEGHHSHGVSAEILPPKTIKAIAACLAAQEGAPPE